MTFTRRAARKPARRVLTVMIIIIIHLLGLAPAGYLTAPDNGPEGRLRGGASQGDGCRAVPLNLLNVPLSFPPRRFLVVEEKMTTHLFLEDIQQVQSRCAIEPFFRSNGAKHSEAYCRPIPRGRRFRSSSLFHPFQ
jgi:hypothetical protein